MTSPIHDHAQRIITKALQTNTRSQVAAYYGISPFTVSIYQDNSDDCGTLNARKVIRVEMARLKALKHGVILTRPTNKDRYKGTRQH